VVRGGGLNGLYRTVRRRERPTRGTNREMVLRLERFKELRQERANSWSLERGVCGTYE
jgi:hypothetical protein